MHEKVHWRKSASLKNMGMYWNIRSCWGQLVPTFFRVADTTFCICITQFITAAEGRTRAPRAVNCVIAAATAWRRLHSALYLTHSAFAITHFTHSLRPRGSPTLVLRKPADFIIFMLLQVVKGIEVFAKNLILINFHHSNIAHACIVLISTTNYRTISNMFRLANRCLH